MENDLTLYEAMYILLPDVEDEEMTEIVGVLRSTVEAADGEVMADELFGRRRLAYEINDSRDGIYRILYFKGTGAAVLALKNEFGLNERIIRGRVLVANPAAIFRSGKEEEKRAEELEERGEAAGREDELAVADALAASESAERPLEAAGEEEEALVVEDEIGEEAAESSSESAEQLPEAVGEEEEALAVEDEIGEEAAESSPEAPEAAEEPGPPAEESEAEAARPVAASDE